MNELLALWQQVKQSKFVRDVAALQVGGLAVMALGFLTSVLVARILHAEGYGVYGLVLSLYGLISLFGSLNVNLPVITRLSEARARRDRAEVLDTLTFFLGMTLVLNLAIFAVGYALSPKLAIALYGNPRVGELTRLFFFSFLFYIFFSYACDVFTGSREMGKVSLLQVVSQGSRTGFILLFILLGYGVLGAVLGTVVASAASALVSVALVRAYTEREDVFPRLSKIFRNLPNMRVRGYLSLSTSVVLSKNLAMVFQHLPILVLGRYGELSQVGHFKVAFSLVAVPMFFMGAISTVLSAKLPETKGRGTPQEVRAQYWRVSLLTLLIAVALMVPFLLAVPLLLRFYGVEYMEARRIVNVLGLYVLISSVGVGIGPILRTYDKMWFVVISNSHILLLFVPLGALLISSYEGVGAAVYLVLMVGTATGLALVYIHRLLCRLTVPVTA